MAYIALPRRVNVRGIIINDNGELLAVQHKGSRYWSTPGGGLDLGESLEDGVTRELIEEVGAQAKVGLLLYIQQYFDGEKEQLELFFHITNPEDFTNIDLAKTTHGMDEVNKCGFYAPSSIELMPLFLRERDILMDIRNNTPVQTFFYK